MARSILSLKPAAAAVLVIVSAAALPATGPAHAADDCLSGPNSSPPQGRHWYYRLEHPGERKCWYLGAEGHPIHAAQAVPAKPHANIRSPAPPPPQESAGEEPAVQVEPSRTPGEPVIAVTDARAADPANALAPPEPDPAPAAEVENEAGDANGDHDALSAVAGAGPASEAPGQAPPRKIFTAATEIAGMLVLIATALGFAGISHRAIFRTAPFGGRARPPARRDHAFAHVRLPAASLNPAIQPGRLTAPVEPVEVPVEMPDDLETSLREILRSLKQQRQRHPRQGEAPAPPGLIS